MAIFDMYKLFIADTNLLHTFLSVADTDYINAVLGNENSNLLINQFEIFSVLNIKTVTDDKDCRIRIPKEILSKLVREGTIEIEIVDGMIHFSIFNDKNICYCKAKFIKQDFPVADYKQKMEVINKSIKNNCEIDLTQFASLEKIMKVTKSILNVSDGVAMLTALNGRVYKEVDRSYRFAVTPFSYGILKRCSDVAYDLDNYMIAQRGGLTVVITKCKGYENLEYSLFLKEKASVICNVNLTDLKYFIYKMSVDSPTIVLNVESRISHFDSSNISYDIPIQLSDLKRTSDNIKEIEIPESVMKSVLFNVDVSNLILAKKKTFTQIRTTDLLIVF